MASAAVRSLDDSQLQAWQRDGFLRLPGFAPAETCWEMLERAVAITREAHAGRDMADTFVTPEPATREGASRPEEAAGKIFRLHHREPVFEAFSREAGLLDLLEGLLGPELDCFLSQFIFKNPGALGQPWHQDSFYFPFEPDTQVGVWLAVTHATPENGPLWVLPGSHREPVHEHVPDRRPEAQYGYVEIVDHDMSAAVPVLMEPGDLLLFDSHLMHRSTDNVSEQIRAAMVYHYSPAGTLDHSLERFAERAERMGFDLNGLDPAQRQKLAEATLMNRWVPVRRRSGG